MRFSVLLAGLIFMTASCGQENSVLKTKKQDVVTEAKKLNAYFFFDASNEKEYLTQATHFASESWKTIYNDLGEAWSQAYINEMVLMQRFASKQRFELFLKHRLTTDVYGVPTLSGDKLTVRELYIRIGEQTSVQTLDKPIVLDRKQDKMTSEAQNIGLQNGLILKLDNLDASFSLESDHDDHEILDLSERLAMRIMNPEIHNRVFKAKIEPYNTKSHTEDKKSELTGMFFFLGNQKFLELLLDMTQDVEAESGLLAAEKTLVNYDKTRERIFDSMIALTQKYLDSNKKNDSNLSHSLTEILESYSALKEKLPKPTLEKTGIHN